MFNNIKPNRKAEKELKASQGKFRAYFEHSQVGMVVTHPDKGWLEVNQRLSDIFGYPFDELKEIGWTKLTHPDDLDEDLQNFQSMINGDFDSYTMNKRMLRKDGQTVFINLSVSCVRDANGEVDKVLASLLDITESKKTEVELQRRFGELNRFRKIAIGRELKMIALKKEINQLLEQHGFSHKYKIQKNSDG
jgi:PAS domain S-box-containing protein